MGARPIAVRQADIARTLRAVKAAGVLQDVRVVIENGRVVVEALRGGDSRLIVEVPSAEADKEIVPL